MKKISIFLIALIFSFIFIDKTYAVSANPSSGSYNPSSTINISINASSQAGENAVTLRITTNNLTITNFVPVSGGQWVGAIAECPGSTYFTSNQVCVSLAKSSDITNGESLGTITAIMGSSTGTLTTTSGTQYSNGSTNRASVGTIGTYNILTTSGGGNNTNPTNVTVLPDTALNSDQNFIIIFGIFIFLIGLAGYLGGIFKFYKWKSNNKNKFILKFKQITSTFKL